MPTTHIYTPPDNPDDPEAAALELIVRMPEAFMHTDAFRPILQEYTTVLHVEGALAGLAWADAKQVAVAIAFDIATREDFAEFFRYRAMRTRLGSDNMAWVDREAAAQAFTNAAEACEL